MSDSHSQSATMRANIASDFEFPAHQILEIQRGKQRQIRACDTKRQTAFQLNPKRTPSISHPLNTRAHQPIPDKAYLQIRRMRRQMGPQRHSGTPRLTLCRKVAVHIAEIWRLNINQRQTGLQQLLLHAGAVTVIQMRDSSTIMVFTVACDFHPNPPAGRLHQAPQHSTRLPGKRLIGASLVIQLGGIDSRQADLSSVTQAQRVAIIDEIHPPHVRIGERLTAAGVRRSGKKPQAKKKGG